MLDAEEKLKRIRQLVDEQAEDEGLWGTAYDFSKPQSIVETYLQQELRKLHALIEELTPTDLSH